MPYQRETSFGKMPHFTRTSSHSETTSSSQVHSSADQPPSPTHSTDQPSPILPVADSFSTIRRNCEQHLRRLERYKKARSFCSTDNDAVERQKQKLEEGEPQQKTTVKMFEGTTGGENPQNQQQMGDDNNGDGTDPQFEELRAKMLTLMENDMRLLAKLLTLGDTLRELRKQKSPQEPAFATTVTSSSSREGEEREGEDQNYEAEEGTGGPWKEAEEKDDDGRDEFRPLHRYRQRRRAPLPPEFGRASATVTKLYLGEENEDRRPKGDANGDDKSKYEGDDDLSPNIQYFSRKNSVLRIPIPPRASNRNFAHPKSLRQRAAEPSSTSIQRIEPRQQQKIDDPPSSMVAEDLDSGHSSASEQYGGNCAGQHSPLGAASSRFSTFSSSLSTATSSSSRSSASSAGETKRAKSEERGRESHK